MSESRYRAVKAYKNEQFMHSADARALRILSEYLEPASRFNALEVKDTIVFFGSARIPSRENAQKALDEVKANGGDLKRAERVLQRLYPVEVTNG